MHVSQVEACHKVPQFGGCNSPQLAGCYTYLGRVGTWKVGWMDVGSYCVMGGEELNDNYISHYSSSM